MKKTLIAASILTSLCVHANSVTTVYSSDDSVVTVGGNAEIDMTYNKDMSKENLQGKETVTPLDRNIDDQWGIGGRILVGINAAKNIEDGKFAKTSVQLLADIDGTVGLDDVTLSIGENNKWEVKVGRFEAYNMFPLGDDVFVDHTGDSADDIYNDGAGYIYQMKEGRGRSASAGQLMGSYILGDFYFELSTMIGDRSDLYAGSTYHGYDINEESKNSFIARPVVAWSVNDQATIAVGMETNLVSEATVINVANKEMIDISERTGYGITANYKTDIFDLNLNAAYLDAVDETDTSIGANIKAYGFGLGYVYSENDIDVTRGYNDADGENAPKSGKHETQTVYASYQFEDVYVRDLDVYLGSYYSKYSPDSSTTDGKETDQYGLKIRTKYYF